MTEYLYLIKCSTEDVSYHKIGIASDPLDRVASLQTGNPLPLLLMATYKFDNAQVVEKSIHQKYKMKRTRGEWFCLSENDIDTFHHICELLGGTNTAIDYGVGVSDTKIEEAEEIQETQDILIGGVSWRLEHRNDRNPPGYAIFQRGEKVYLGYLGKRSLKDPEHPTIEEVESVIAKKGKQDEQYQ